MRKRKILLCVGALWLSLVLGSSAQDGRGSGKGETAGKRPNIIFIILDDLNDSVEGFGGHPQALTPNIDRLAGTGVRFMNAASNAPICSPSRPSMLTGLYPHTAGYFGTWNPQAIVPSVRGIRRLEDGTEFSVLESGMSWDMPAYRDAKSWVQYFKEHGYDVRVGGKLYHNGHKRWSDLENEEGAIVYGPMPSWGPFPFSGSGHGSGDRKFNLRSVRLVQRLAIEYQPL